MKTQEEITALSATDKFSFLCAKENSCFNQCCANLNQLLTPYDILRLKNALNMDSGEFLKEYCVQYNGQETGLPVVSLKPDYKNELSCPFVSELGCKVYKDRPASCRLYPLARMASRNRETGKITEYFALIKEGHCKGFERGKEYTSKEWIKNQNAEEYNRINDYMIQIVGIARGIEPATFDESIKNIFAMTCYDIDKFKMFISKDDFKGNEIAKSLGYKDEIFKDDETALLLFGLDYIKAALLRIKDK